MDKMQMQNGDAVRMRESDLLVIAKIIDLNRLSLRHPQTHLRLIMIAYIITCEMYF
jgi:hypothetical protein